MTTEAVIEIRGFKGINIREPVSLVQDDELVECINFDIGRAGELAKRTGFFTQHNGATLGLNSVRLVGQFHTFTHHQLIVQAGPSVWYSTNGVAWTKIGDFTASFGVQYVDKFYMVSPTGLIREWDGSGAGLLDQDTAKTVSTVGDWSNKLNATVSRDVTAVRLYPGQVATLKAVATAASQMQIKTTEGNTGRFLVNPGEAITFKVRARPNVTTRDIDAIINYWTSAGVFISSETVSVNCPNDAYTLIQGNHVVPATARYASFQLEVDAPAAAQEFNFADMSIQDASGREILNSPSGTFCQVFRDRLYVLNSDASDGSANSKLFFSEINNFNYNGWPSVNNLLVSPGDGDFLTCLSVIHDTLIIFKTESTWGLYVQGEPDSWVLRNMNPEIGCISKFTPREIEGFLYFVGPRGVYKTDGNLFEDISSNITPAFENRVVNLSNANLDCAAWWEDKYILLFNPTPSTRRYFVYHLRSGGWTEWEFTTVKPSYFVEIYSTNPSKGLWAGDLNATGKVFKYGDDIKTDDGSNYQCRIKSKHFDFGFPGKMKRAKWFAAELEGAGAVNWVNETEQGDKSIPVSISEAARKTFKVKGAEYFRSWSVEMNMTTSQAFTMYGISLAMHGKEKLIKTAT